MKIIQLIVIEDNCVQGLGDDGKLYDLHWKAASFNRFDKQWVLAEGLQTLASRIGEILMGAFKDAVQPRLTAFADKHGLYVNIAQSVNEDAVIHTLKVGSEVVTVTQTSEMLTIRGSDGSEHLMKLVGTQYV